ncbi:exosortase-associated EpsI family protein [Chlorobium phaeovibrioides]|uniref:Exosortase-associated EpsI family protein n=2 Tax=Chlorobium phaeovibrioides TaxID=1094 RepID=A0A5M8IAR3_CHLPH|nr:exosortase-associated EpsI family protein [Chlorobium phaeovibrioides]KAA6232090.1 exosortase-associated EpsI family protein [Chlorobium phaeovibrioides]
MRIHKQGLVAVAFGLMLSLALLVVVLIKTPVSVILSTVKGGPDVARIITHPPPGWHEVEGRVVEPDRIGAAERAYDKVLGQGFRHNDGREVMVVMTWSADGLERKGHQQQFCYAAGGYEVDVPHHVQVRVRDGVAIDAVEFRAKHYGAYEDVLYWLVTGGRQELVEIRVKGAVIDDPVQTRIREWREQIIEIRHRITRSSVGVPDNLMVRVSCRVPEGRPDCEAHKEFVRDWIASLPEKDRVVLLGR